MAVHLRRRELTFTVGGAVITLPLAARALTASMISTCLLASGASAQTFPDRPVTMLVAFPPGGADDATARIIQDPMQKALGQPIVIENLGGAGGMIAAAKAAHAEPDGYTILLHQDALAAGMTLYPNRTFDAEKDFVAIGLVNITAITLAGRPTLPPNSPPKPPFRPREWPCWRTSPIRVW